jgi:hypothetical protein
MKCILLILFSLTANAGCFSDQYGNQTCINQSQGQTDFRNDYNSPKIYENGQYRGNLNNNQYDPNSISNEYGRFGNPYSSESIKNPYRSRW